MRPGPSGTRKVLWCWKRLLLAGVFLLELPGRPATWAQPGEPLPPIGMSQTAQSLRPAAPAPVADTARAPQSLPPSLPPAVPQVPIPAPAATAAPVAEQAPGLAPGQMPPPPANPPGTPAQLPPPVPVPPTGPVPDGAGTNRPVVETNVLPIDLVSVLKLADAQNPTILLARARIGQAMAELARMRVLWLPNLWVGGNPGSPAFVPTYFGHWGYIQNAPGNLFSNVNRNAVFLPVGLGVDYELSRVLFAPLIARRVADAQTANARAINNNVLLDAVITYLDLLRLYNELAILNNTLYNAETMVRYAEAAEKAGTGKTPADAPRARAEAEAIRRDMYDVRRMALMTSARLAQLLLLEPTLDLRPADPTVVPVRLVPTDGDLRDLVLVGLNTRPEIVRERALVDAAVGRRREAIWEPALPFAQGFIYEGWYAGGPEQSLNRNGNRVDVLLQAAWQLRNMGLGNVGLIRQRGAEVDMAGFALKEMEARVGAEVTAAAQEVRQREASMNSAEQAVRQQAETYRRLEAAGFGLGLGGKRYDPLEALTAVRDLNMARMRYLAEVIGYNQAQFRLFTAMGQPPQCALPGEGNSPPLTTPFTPRPGGDNPVRDNQPPGGANPPPGGANLPQQ
jgi:outer membrane protein TolC